MRNGLAVFLTMALSAALVSAAERAFDPDALADEAIARVKPAAYRTREVDWPPLEAKVRAAAHGAKDHVDMLAAYQTLLDGLGDGHSFVATAQANAEEFRKRYGRNYNSTRPRREFDDRFINRAQPASRTLALGTASATLVEVPRFSGGGERAQKYAQAAFDAVAAGADRSCGYVVDLRGNLGGNVWPMLAGLGPLFGDGPVYYGINRDGKRASEASVAGASSRFGADGGTPSPQISVPQWHALPRLAGLPVAVLIDNAVASSGEGITVGMKGRANTRLFGQKTLGSASSNVNYEIGERTTLLVTVEMLSDRRGNIYPMGIEPDQAVAYGDGDPADPDDAVVEAAKAWLRQQPGCAAG